MFDQFHGIGVLPKSLLSYFVTLIPKVNLPFGLGDYRPISLFGCLYKIIAKVLTNRLAKVMDFLIASNQSAFIKGRNLVDGVLVVNEVLDLAKRTRSPCVIFKVDFEKAYDSIDWGFLEYMLTRFGFRETWIGWMKACVFGGNFSVLVNGSPTGEINIHRGLKQGDPLAHFLFLLVAEGMGGVMSKAVERNLFKGFKVQSDGPSISHLQYADDTLCIGEPSVENLWTLKAIRRGFELASELKVNFWKSCLVGVNVCTEFMEMACTFLNCKKGGFPFKYLGLPVGTNPRTMSTWVPLLDCLRKKLNSWGHRHISLGGRLVLINSVLNSIHIFYMSLMKMSVQVLKKVIRIQRDFLWGGVNGGKKLSWIKWSVVCQEKNCGGLGVRDLKAVNLSLLMKWRWRLLQRSEVGLWKEVLVAKYGSHILNNVSWINISNPYFASSWWKDIGDLESYVDSKNWLTEAVSRSLGNGMLTRFWSDVWIGDAKLCSKFPRLFSLSLQRDACVSEVVVREEEETLSWNLTWRRRLFQWEEDSLNQLVASLGSVRLSNVDDKWRWSCDPDGVFSVKSTYDSISKELTVGPTLPQFQALIFKKIWDSPTPSKVIVFSWQLLHDRVPTKVNLRLRGILPIESSCNCVWCPNIGESASHLFLHCKVALDIWYEVFRWLGVIIIIPPTSVYFLKF
ncbi:hypothetical protein TSUD_352620 [Trifolium subterraneum]|nr:hypothetical protein TSUD_352620 [Trifolium subterraneum]